MIETLTREQVNRCTNLGGNLSSNYMVDKC